MNVIGRAVLLFFNISLTDLLPADVSSMLRRNRTAQVGGYSTAH